MASKFMAFENEASTSHENQSTNNDGMFGWPDEEHERIEMNVNQFPNYQSNGSQAHQPSQVIEAIEPSPYGAVDEEEDDLNENLQEKGVEKSQGYRKFLYNNSEQFKSICGGLILLMGSGIHIVWGIFRIFNLYQCGEENSFYLRFVIWSWYIGAIIGSCLAGFAIATIRKGHLYFVGGALLIVSGMLLCLSDAETNIYLLISRTLGGLTQGLTYVTIIVHASENATKEFREFLMLIIGAVMNYSLMIAVLCFFHTEGLFSSSFLNGLGLFSCGVCAMVVTLKHSTETVPFLLQNNGSELDALQTVSKLKKKPIAARSVHHDFLLMKNLVHDELDYYGKPEFRKILMPENQKSLLFCCYGRLCSVLSFNLPIIVMILLFLRAWVDESVKANDVIVRSYCPSENHVNANIENLVVKNPAERNKTDEIEHHHKKLTQKESHSEREKRHVSENEKSKTVEKDHERSYEESEEKINEGSESMKKEKEIKTERNDEDRHEHEEENAKGEHKSRKKEESNEEKHKKEHEKAKENQREENSQANIDKEQSEREQNKLKENPKEKYEKNSKESEESGSESESEKKSHKKLKNETEEKHSEKSEKNSKENSENEKLKENISESKKNSKEKAEKEGEKAAPKLTEKTFFGHVIIFLHSRELTLVLLAWFVFGTLTTAFLYTLNLKRFIYYISCVLSCALAISGLAHSFHLFSGILHFSLIVYFNYVTIPIDVFGHCMLAEAFPVTLKAFSIAGVASIEHFVHIIIIGVYMTEWFHDTIIIFMSVVAFVAYEVARNLPQKSNLPLAEAREEYQKIDLMLFNEPKVNRQEFI